MIRTDKEYKEALKRRKQQERHIKKQEVQLKGMGLTKAQLKRGMDPVRTFHLNLVDEIKEYELLKKGNLKKFDRLMDIGRALVASRIAAGVTQRELAERLGVHESQVSRDERNEYHGVTLVRAARVMEALEVDIKGSIVIRRGLQAKQAKKSVVPKPRAKRKLAGKASAHPATK